jgi:methionyl-tRNA formyltransferase
VNSPSQIRKWKVIFAGSPAYAIPSLSTIYSLPQVEVVGVLTQKPKPRGRGQTEALSDIGEWARNHNIFTIHPDSLRTPEAFSTLQGLNADAGIVVAYGKIIPKSILDLLPLGWVNAHASLLPRWRGASPIQHALLAGDSETGVTLMKVFPGLDDGPTFAEKKVSIPPNIYSPELAKLLSELSAQLFRDKLLAFLEGKVKLVPQDSTKVTLAPKIEKIDGNILWTESAKILERKIRAYTPWPGTYTTWNGAKLIIISAEVYPGIFKPGLVANLDGFCVIGTGQNLLKPIRLQIAGKKPLDIKAFISGYPRFIGECLGS